MTPRLQAVLLAALTLLAGAAVRPQTSGDVVLELAAKVAGVLGSAGEVRVEVRNLTAEPDAEIAAAKAGLERELRRAGLIISETPATRVLITVSENLESRIWTADIRRTARRDVVIVSRTQTPAADQARSGLPVEIRRRLVLEQRDPILDVAVAGDDILVLSPDSLSISRRTSQGWQSIQEVRLPDLHTRSRDPRGRLILRQGGLTAYLPGLTCEAAIDPTLHATCEAGERDWPAGLDGVKLAPGRNYFTRGTLTPFFSVAMIPDAGNARWICSGTDGRVRVLDRGVREIGLFGGFGSDIAALANPCGSGAALIASLPADTRGQCTLGAFEISSGGPVAISPPLELPGTLTALWPSESQDVVLAVIRNTRTGYHVAFHLFLSCGR